MNEDEKQEIAIKRDYLVVKDNQLVRSRCDLRLAEQRAIAYICSMIKPIEHSAKADGVPSYQLEYTFDINEYAKVCGLDPDSGKFYQDTRTVLRNLMKKILEVKLPNGDEVFTMWLVTAELKKQSGKIKVKINDDIAHLLFDLKNNFTAYSLFNILAMKSQYSIRIYEILKSYAFQNGLTIEVEELKRILMVDKKKSYSNFKDFRKYVIEPAIEEINGYTNLNVGYEPITQGRKVIKVKFLISKKATFDRFLSFAKINKEIEE